MHTPQEVNENTLFLLKEWLKGTNKIPMYCKYKGMDVFK